MAHQIRSSRRLKQLLCTMTSGTKFQNHHVSFSSGKSSQHQMIFKAGYKFENIKLEQTPKSQNLFENIYQSCFIFVRAIRLRPRLQHSDQSLHTYKLRNWTPEQDDIPYPLTRKEAFYFLENVLLISDPAKLLEQDSMLFLNTFIHGMTTKIPFTSIPHVSQHMDDKHCPNFAECKEAIFSRGGEDCFYKNIFSKALLDLMGYKTFHVGGNNNGEEQLDTHTGLIVCDLSYPGSLHLAEPGTRRPLFEAIPLDFDQESPVYHFHFMKSKFFKKDDGILLWCAHAPGHTAPSTYIIESGNEFWKIQLTYRLHQQRSRKYFTEKAHNLATIPTLIPSVHYALYLLAYKEKKLFSYFYQNQKDLVSLKVQGEHLSDLSESEIQLLSPDEMIDSIVDNFPQYTRETIQTALDNVRYGSRLYCL